MLKPALVLAFGALIAATAHAQVYKWRDADGRLHFGDQPPPGVTATQMRGGPARAPAAAEITDEASVEDETSDDAQAATAPPPAAPQESATTQPSAAEAAEAMRAEREKAQAAKAQAAAEREREQMLAENCQRARNQLTALEGGQRIARFNEKGEREVLDDAARAQEISRMREFIDANCSGR
ncbi:DUF4124 domain-containing protein [Pseudazoarcus pumilus]|uniref:DUF4124 domain-containing protein n=1 Tax=Pseudazoarcus pumilus TaxID=2067960 RepID=A0A2I6SAZ9_9RHOO|nr:DUF4124 domain-containing protein [Pseudazoarcus pumilus]AUN96432.1 DUF4124 domain-containing protein [Pseudazoarcus pumilus]